MMKLAEKSLDAAKKTNINSTIVHVKDGISEILGGVTNGVKQIYNWFLG